LGRITGKPEKKNGKELDHETSPGGKKKKRVDCRGDYFTT